MGKLTGEDTYSSKDYDFIGSIISANLSSPRSSKPIYLERKRQGKEQIGLGILLAFSSTCSSFDWTSRSVDEQPETALRADSSGKWMGSLF